MSSNPDPLEQALRELEGFARDPHRERLLQKFQCNESRQLSELLGTALLREQRVHRQIEGPATRLPIPAGLVHPG